MAKKGVTRRELLDRWRGIEEEEEDDDDVATSVHPKSGRFRRLKEEWFSDAFNFLVLFPNENHIWCSSWDLMGPLLETFYNYYEDDRHDSPLKLLWNRLSDEMRRCTQCICQHHQAQEMYKSEYELSSIGPLLDVLQNLDEERITKHLQEMNSRILRGEYDPVRDNAEVVSVMFEVLMYPVLMDDEPLVTEFQVFIEAIDNSHELSLAGHQQYPGVYALLFLKSRRSRSIGLRLAGNMGKLRRATDLDPLQPLLKKCISFLETETGPPAAPSSRPRVKLDRVTAWLGIKALLGFLEPPAFEEGILEPYPVVLSIILNHISDDSPEFSYAVNCLRLLFEMLGCKLWLRATLSPSVMRNTLLGQCFHTRSEKIHKEIFDLFQPFLQSLEALQDGEHEKQRRHFIYFLLQQVTVSRNFSTLIRKKACQIALLIVLRGYKMVPPCPPSECTHMWGPSLISSLKDSSLHSSLRQPAFDLIQAIIVSDAAALVMSLFNCPTQRSISKNMLSDFADDDDEVLFANEAEEKDFSCWVEFSVQSKVTSREWKEWMCSPMLWLDALLEIDPLVLPISVSKAVLWSLSRFSMVENESSSDMALPLKTWLSTRSSEISHLFGWKAPSGSDDGGDGKESKNSVKVSTMCIPLIKTFKRFTSHFIVAMEQGELRKQWTWEPRMSESLILLLVDPNDSARQVGRRILEQVSNTRGLACGLEYLCSCSSSLSGLLFGLRHALNLVQVDSVMLNFQSLHHFFFVLCKLLKEGVALRATLPRSSKDDIGISKFSSQGGFLQQPVINPVLIDLDSHPASVDASLWQEFCCLLAEMLWPFILKCLEEGKALIDHTISQGLEALINDYAQNVSSKAVVFVACWNIHNDASVTSLQMTCVRVLEILPVVVERLQSSSHHNVCNNSRWNADEFINYRWLNDLIDWGRSALAVIVRYWKQTVTSLLGLLKQSCSNDSTSVIRIIEKLVSCETISMDELTEHISRLSVSLSHRASYAVEDMSLKSNSLVSEDFSFKKKIPPGDSKAILSVDADLQTLESEKQVNKTDIETITVISDDETEEEALTSKSFLSKGRDNLPVLDDNKGASGVAGRISQSGVPKMNVSNNITAEFPVEELKIADTLDSDNSASRKLDLNASRSRLNSAHLMKSKSAENSNKDHKSKSCVNSSLTSQCKSKLSLSTPKPISGNSDQTRINKNSEADAALVKELVRNAEDDSRKFVVKTVRCQPTNALKPNTSGPKRQVIQLNLGLGSRSSYAHRQGAVKRFTPPNLDDWFRPILEIDYFASVGLTSSSEKGNQTVAKLKDVPVSFESPGQYVEIFRPLVLEEFKAQLQSSFAEMTSPEEMCCGSLSVLSVERIDDFHLVRCLHDDGDSAGSRSVSDNDLILLTRQPLQKTSHDVHIVGKVERREKDNKRRSTMLVIRFYLQNGSARLNRARSLLLERSKWFVSRIMSITPQLREFQALSSINSIPLLPIILNPINHGFSDYESRKRDLSKLPQPLQRILKSSYNESQVQAIALSTGHLDSMKEFDMSLIQGPPGTGKTRTILAIVSGLLASQKSHDMKNPLSGSLKTSNALGSNLKSRLSESTAIARAWQDAAVARQLNDVADSPPVGNCRRGRVLICAQSNAAVDELVSRISKEGIYGSDGEKYRPYLVRVGNAKTVHTNSLPFFIDTLVDQKLDLERKTGNIDVGTDLSTALRANLEKLVDQIRFYETRRAHIRDVNSNPGSLSEREASKVEDDGKEMSEAELDVKLRKLYQEKKTLYSELGNAQARERKTNEEIRALRHNLRRSILREAEIVVTTLSGCGGDLYGVCSESMSRHKFSNASEHVLFDAVVIDEAAQALEPATLIPLQLLKSKRTKCIMVGDPKQLPATVLSNVASKYQYQCSMFERLQRAGHPVIMLTEQYRMHPQICQFPSMHFYDKKLLNGDQTSSKSAPFHETEALGPYVFFDIIDGHELRGNNSGGMSLFNECEADAAVEILRFFKKRYPSEFMGGRIGVITPYKRQLSLLRSRFSGAFGPSITAEMEFNTVDGFQGREVDILLLSTVRASGSCSATNKDNSSNIGFVADVRRMNVALTRARLSMWILGNARTLQTNRNWAALVKDAEERNLVVSVKKPYEFMLKSSPRNHPLAEKSSDKAPKHLKHGAKFRNNSWDASKQNDTEGVGRKKSSFHSEGNSRSREGKNPSETRENFKTDKREERGKGGSDRSKGRESSSSQTDGQISRSTNGKSVNEDSRKKADQSKKVVGDRSKHLKSIPPKELKEPSELNKRQRKVEGEIPSTAAGTSQGKDRDGEGGVLNQVDRPEDAITKRKKQREAVEALLPSALISSKKKTSLPLKRPVSPKSTSGHGIRPPKLKKGPSSTSSANDDQSNKHHPGKRKKL